MSIDGACAQLASDGFSAEQYQTMAMEIMLTVDGNIIGHILLENI